MGGASQCPIRDRKRKASNAEDEAIKAAKTAIDSTAEHQTGDPFLQALSDIQQSIERAVALSRERMFGIDPSKAAGASSRSAAVTRGAADLITPSIAKLSTLLNDIGGKTKVASICDLPSEIICHIFEYLDIESLLDCQFTCFSWSKILEDEMLWDGAEVEVHGALWQIDANWYRVKQKVPRPTRLSLKMWLSAHEMEGEAGLLWRRIAFSDIIRDFPTSSLQEFRHEGDMRGVNEKIWEALLDCTKLKVLHWKSRRMPMSSTFGVRYSFGIGERSALASCRLEEFSFDVIPNEATIVVDAAFMGMLSQVKRLAFANGMLRSTIVDILTTACATIEDLNVIGHVYGAYGGTKPGEPLKMKSLQRISVQDEDFGILPIIAPQTRRAHFSSCKLVDWTLIDSCRHNLQALHIHVRGMKTEGRLGQELFDMPQLEELHMDFRREGKRGFRGDYVYPHVGRYKDYSIATFWKAVKSTNATLVESILPKLKNLKNLHDPILDQDSFIRFIKGRSETANLSLQKVDISLANHCSNDTSRLDRLKQRMPVFTYRRFDEWKDKDTREWTLTSNFNSRTEGVDWNTVNDCRFSLKTLSFSVQWGKDGEGLDAELFDMPELETLVLRFSDSHKDRGCRSAAALWSAVKLGSTGKAKVPMRYILPKLKKLEVINDAMLDEETVVELIAIRKELGLTPFETLKIHLAKEHSKQVSKLADLAITMKDFSYKRFEDWK